MRTRALLYTAATLVLIGVVAGLVLLPLHNRHVRFSNDIQAARQQIADFNRIMAELPLFLKTRGELADQKTKLSSRLYAKDDILRLFTHLNELANKRNLQITEINPPVEELLRLNRAGIDSTATELLLINLKMQGTYLNFGRFLASIEQADYFRGISDCAIMGAPNGASVVQMQVGFYALISSMEDAT
ncbi:MAG: hypothetical protein AB1744_11040 [Candidatus Zixiibacteriota bacterium]